MSTQYVNEHYVCLFVTHKSVQMDEISSYSQKYTPNFDFRVNFNEYMNKFATRANFTQIFASKIQRKVKDGIAVRNF